MKMLHSSLLAGLEPCDNEYKILDKELISTFVFNKYKFDIEMLEMEMFYFELYGAYPDVVDDLRCILFTKKFIHWLKTTYPQLDDEGIELRPMTIKLIKEDEKPKFVINKYHKELSKTLSNSLTFCF